MAVLGLVAAVVALYPIFDRPSVDLEAVQISTEATQLVAAVEEGGGQTQTTAAQLDLRLRNRGDLSAAITSIGVVVREVLPLELCVEAGGFEQTTAVYDLTIPEDADAGDQFEAPAAQSIAPGATDRFTLSLGTDAFAAIYELEVFVREGTSKVGLGTVVALLPPTAKDAYRILAWDESWEGTPFNTQCAVDFERKLTRVATSEGVVASAVSQLASDVQLASRGGLGSVPRLTN